MVLTCNVEAPLLEAETVRVFDGVLSEPYAYRESALRQPYESVPVADSTFHGIALPPVGTFAGWFQQYVPGYEPTLSFLRKSPLGQEEPNFIHNDADMGDVTAILYLNPNPPAEDGTSFWEMRESGARQGAELAGEIGKNLSGWRCWHTVPAKFNRALVFAAPLYHSRAISENYGAGDDARLIQVLFARRSTKWL